MNASTAEPLSSRLAMLAERHGRLLLLQLVAAVDELQSLCPAACADPVFAEAWSRFASLRGQMLAAVAEPAVEAWIGQVQALLRTPLLRTCPDQHITRVLARFSAFMIHLAGLQGGASEGTALLLGSGSVPLLLGRAQLRPASVRYERVRWTWNGSLRLLDDRGETVVEVDPDGHALSPPARGWRVERARALGEVAVFTEPRCVQHPGAAAAPRFLGRFTRAYEALPASAGHLLQLSIRSAGPDCDLHPLEAHGWLGTSGSPTAPELAERLAAKLVSRCELVYAFDTSRRLGDALGTGEREDLVQAVARELLTDRAGAPESMLARLVAACLERSPPRPDGVPPPAPVPSLALQPVLIQAGIQGAEPAVWTEPKHHQMDRAPGWRVLDALLSLAPGEIERLRAALAGWPEPEVRHFGLACVNYHEGRFPDSVTHLLACLAADRACEEYWLLLAFCCRHLRRFDLFEDIAYGPLRTEAVLEDAARGLRCTP